MKTRRVVVVAIIILLSISALVGIFVVFRQGSGSSEALRVVGTTAALGACGVLILCHLAVALRPQQIVGMIGIAVSAVAVLSVIGTIWLSDVFFHFEWLFPLAGASSVAAFGLAHINLVLTLSARRNPIVRFALVATIIAIVVTASMLCISILSNGVFPPAEAQGLYWQVLSVVAILDVLGSIVLPVANKFLTAGTDSAVAIIDPAESPTSTITITLPPHVHSELMTLSGETGLTVESLAVDAVVELLARSESI